MKIACGVDIIEISRIEKAIERQGEKFLQTVYTENEIQYCESHKTNKFQHYAARFAAKEAVFKALSWKLEDKYAICWKDIEVVDDKQGRPSLNIIGMNLNDIENIDISLSHCKEYAVANVTVLTKI